MRPVSVSAERGRRGEHRLKKVGRNGGDAAPPRLNHHPTDDGPPAAAAHYPAAAAAAAAAVAAHHGAKPPPLQSPPMTTTLPPPFPSHPPPAISTARPVAPLPNATASKATKVSGTVGRARSGRWTPSTATVKACPGAAATATPRRGPRPPRRRRRRRRRRPPPSSGRPPLPASTATLPLPMASLANSKKAGENVRSRG
jgi:hypothetical protein